METSNTKQYETHTFPQQTLNLTNTRDFFKWQNHYFHLVREYRLPATEPIEARWILERCLVLNQMFVAKVEHFLSLGNNKFIDNYLNTTIRETYAILIKNIILLKLHWLIITILQKERPNTFMIWCWNRHDYCSFAKPLIIHPRPSYSIIIFNTLSPSPSIKHFSLLSLSPVGIMQYNKSPGRSSLVVVHAHKIKMSPFTLGNEIVI